MLLASSLLCVFAFALPTPQADGDFSAQAKALREKESWPELTSLAKKEIASAEDDSLALAYLAIGQAGQKEFPASIASLKKLQDGGTDLDDALAGLGSPLVEVVNTIYSHCWANFDAEFNRKCWQPMFSEFPQSKYSPIAASRLLMASLKDNQPAEIKIFEEFFEERLAAAMKEKDAATEADLTKRYVDGYLRAGVSNARVMKLAGTVWDHDWSAASQQHSYSGPLTGGELTEEQLLARRECELDTDHSFNTLAQAFHLAGVELQAGHPLFEMEGTPDVTFDDATEKVGLAGVKESRVAVADFDNDGDPDLCFSGRLFENQKGKFVEVGKERGITHKGAGAVFGDFDGDNNMDLILASSPKPILYRNLGKRGKYQFENVSAASGLNDVTFGATPEGLAWVDFDDDGDLDLYFAIYESPMAQGHPDVLLENRGKGKFVDVSESMGIHTTGPFCGRGVSPCDVDGDGDSEIFVSNYRLNENTLWQWDGKKLSEQSESFGIKGVREPADGHYFGHTIGSCWGDVDGDGDIDLFSANLAHPRFVRQGFSNLSMLGINQGDGTFTNEMLTRGVRFQETHSDPALIDIDNDGDLDLSLTCIYEGVSSALYQNDGSGNFTPITFRANAGVFHAWGQAWLDFDGDGFLDVIYASGNGVTALRNSGNENHYIRLDLRSKAKDSSGFGAIITVETMEEGSSGKWVRQLLNARGTTSQDEQIVHFGLGEYSGKVRVSVRWPNSKRVQSKTPKADRIYSIKQ